MTEVWKEIAGYGGRYEVSDHGNIRSNTTRPRVLTQHTLPTGYVFCTTRGSDGKTINFRVGREVALAFLDAPNGREVNHKDGDKANNHVSNLEWATKSANCTHRSRVLGKVRGEVHGRARLTEDQVRAIRLDKRYAITIAAELGVASSTIDRIRSGQAWRHVA